MLKPDEGTNGAFMTKEVTFLNGIYNDMSLLINIACKVAAFLFRNSKKRLAVKLININCDKKCKILHHNFSNNLLRMLGASAISSKHQFIPSFQYINLIRMKQKRKFFLFTDLIRRKRVAKFEYHGYSHRYTRFSRCRRKLYSEKNRDSSD